MCWSPRGTQQGAETWIPQLSPEGHCGWAEAVFLYQSCPTAGATLGVSSPCSLNPLDLKGLLTQLPHPLLFPLILSVLLQVLYQTVPTEGVISFLLELLTAIKY